MCPKHNQHNQHRASTPASEPTSKPTRVARGRSARNTTSTTSTEQASQPASQPASQQANQRRPRPMHPKHNRNNQHNQHRCAARNGCHGYDKLRWRPAGMRMELQTVDTKRRMTAETGNATPAGQCLETSIAVSRSDRDGHVLRGGWSYLPAARKCLLQGSTPALPELQERGVGS